MIDLIVVGAGPAGFNSRLYMHLVLERVVLV